MTLATFGLEFPSHPFDPATDPAELDLQRAERRAVGAKHRPPLRRVALRGSARHDLLLGIRKARREE